jgi:hypothetical protein
MCKGTNIVAVHVFVDEKNVSDYVIFLRRSTRKVSMGMRGKCKKGKCLFEKEKGEAIAMQRAIHSSQQLRSTT